MSDNTQEENTNVVSLEAFKQAKQDSKPTIEAVPNRFPKKQPVDPDNDPDEPWIQISTADGDIVMRGYLGLTNTFLAIGTKSGKIKFAAAPGKWNYATDVTELVESDNEENDNSEDSPQAS